MKVFDHTIYASTKIDRHDKTSALSVPSVVDTYQYSYVDNSDLIGSVTFPNGLVTTKTYETNRNLIDKVENNFNGTARSVYDFTNDAIGRRSDVAKSGTAFTAADTITYAYNDRSEVTGATATNDTKYNFGYNFDNLGNRVSSSTSESGSAVATNYTANALNQYTAVDTHSPTYDADGNMTGTWLTQPDGNKADSDLYYNAENRLVKVIGNGQKLEFTYDYMGRRVSKKVYSGSESAWTLEKQTTFTYDGWNLIQEVEASVYDSNNSVFTQFRTSNYTWGLDLSQTLQGAGGVGGLLAASIPNYPFVISNYYYTYDANGNVSELIDTAGVVKAHYEYSPFGKVVHKSGPLADKNPFQFSTKYLDNETQLYYYGYRYYNPENGRWINRDPIGESGGKNLYAFINNQATREVDVLGEKALWSGTFRHLLAATDQNFIQYSNIQNVLTLLLKGGKMADNGPLEKGPLTVVNMFLLAEEQEIEIRVGHSKETVDYNTIKQLLNDQEDKTMVFGHGMTDSIKYSYNNPAWNMATLAMVKKRVDARKLYGKLPTKRIELYACNTASSLVDKKRKKQAGFAETLSSVTGIPVMGFTKPISFRHTIYLFDGNSKQITDKSKIDIFEKILKPYWNIDLQLGRYAGEYDEMLKKWNAAVKADKKVCNAYWDVYLDKTRLGWNLKKEFTPVKK